MNISDFLGLGTWKAIWLVNYLYPTLPTIMFVGSIHISKPWNPRVFISFPTSFPSQKTDCDRSIMFNSLNREPSAKTKDVNELDRKPSMSELWGAANPLRGVAKTPKAPGSPISGVGSVAKLPSDLVKSATFHRSQRVIGALRTKKCGHPFSIQ